MKLKAQTLSLLPQWLCTLTESLKPQGLQFSIRKLKIMAVPTSEGCCEIEVGWVTPINSPCVHWLARVECSINISWDCCWCDSTLSTQNYPPSLTPLWIRCHLKMVLVWFSSEWSVAHNSGMGLPSLCWPWKLPSRTRTLREGSSELEGRKFTNFTFQKKKKKKD